LNVDFWSLTGKKNRSLKIWVCDRSDRLTAFTGSWSIKVKFACSQLQIFGECRLHVIDSNQIAWGYMVK